MKLLTRPSQLSGHAMRVDSEYLRSWRDLRRREFLFWFFVLSYVPGIAIIIVLMDRFGSDVLDRIGTYFSAAWLVGFAGASFYRQHFHCPRCHKFFFRRFKLLEPYARNCVNCNLACGALDP
jgi:hypothetical protein